MLKTFSIFTLGCKVNQYESQQIREWLQRHELTYRPESLSADLILVNSCCVTHTASSKSRQYIRKAQKHNPKSVIVLTGCLPVGQTDELINLANETIIIHDKKELIPSLSVIIESKSGIKQPICPEINTKKDLADQESTQPLSTPPLTVCNNDDSLDTLHEFKGQSRAFVKIQDGCDGYCSYCIIPKIRTTITNKKDKEIIQECSNLVYAGHKEIVLTGIFLGAYGQSTVKRRKWDPEKKDLLANLLEQLCEIKGLERIRLSSLEPADVTDRLLDVMVSHSNVMPHLHLPLQSGSPAILKRMARQYTIDDFYAVIDKLKNRLDRPAITTDIIVGFPGESDEDFQKTIQVVQDVEFSKIHVFSYSERKNTPAEKMKPKIANDIIKKRSAHLQTIDRCLQENFRKQFIGETVSIIVEEMNPARGRSERYFMAEAVDHINAAKGDLVYTKLIK